MFNPYLGHGGRVGYAGKGLLDLETAAVCHACVEDVRRMAAVLR